MLNTRIQPGEVFQVFSKLEKYLDTDLDCTHQNYMGYLIIEPYNMHIVFLVKPQVDLDKFMMATEMQLRAVIKNSGILKYDMIITRPEGLNNQAFFAVRIEQ